MVLAFSFQLTKMGFHTLSNLLIRGTSTTIRFGSILPNVCLGVRRLDDVPKLLLVKPCCQNVELLGERR